MGKLLLPRDICVRCIGPIKEGEQTKEYPEGTGHEVCPPLTKELPMEQEGEISIPSIP